jgi:hypothetical protein
MLGMVRQRVDRSPWQPTAKVEIRATPSLLLAPRD